MASFAYLFERFPSFTKTFCQREVAEMVAQKMEPRIFSLRPPDEQSKGIDPELAERIHYLPERAVLKNKVNDAIKARQLPPAVHKALKMLEEKGDKSRIGEAVYLAQLLREEKISHVHAHFAGMAARTAYWLKKLYGVEFSFTGHANDIFCETDLPVSLADLMHEAKFVVTETDFSRQWLCEKFPQHVAKTHRVYNGIEMVKVSPQPKTLPPVILSVGRYVEKKGFSDLIAASAVLHGNGEDFQCRIIGSGPLEQNLREQIDELSLQNLVQLVAPKTQSELRREFAAASLFVLPCVHETDGGMDNLPTVIVEAMVAGLPVISTALAGIPEMIHEGETGYFSEDKNPESLAMVMQKLLSDPLGAQEMGRKGQLLAEEKFDIRQTTGDLKKLLLQNGVMPPRAALAHDPALKSP